MNYTIIYPEGVTAETFQKVALPGKNKWTTALRSGEYKQGTGCLYSGAIKTPGVEDKEPNCYCCLGVLSAIQGRLEKNLFGGFDSHGGDSQFLTLTNPLYSIIEGTGRLPFLIKLENGDSWDCLAPCNDNGLTFNQIADIIDAAFYDPEEK